MEHPLTVHALRNTGCGSTHLSSSTRTNGHLTLLILIHSTIMSGVQCSKSTRSSHQTPKPRLNWRSCLSGPGLTCLKNRSTKPSWRSGNDCNGGHFLPFQGRFDDDNVLWCIANNRQNIDFFRKSVKLLNGTCYNIQLLRTDVALSELQTPKWGVKILKTDG